MSNIKDYNTIYIVWKEENYGVKTKRKKRKYYL